MFICEFCKCPSEPGEDVSLIEKFGYKGDMLLVKIGKGAQGLEKATRREVYTP